MRGGSETDAVRVADERRRLLGASVTSKPSPSAPPTALSSSTFSRLNDDDVDADEENFGATTSGGDVESRWWSIPSSSSSSSSSSSRGFRRGSGIAWGVACAAIVGAACVLGGSRSRGGFAALGDPDGAATSTARLRDMDELEFSMSPEADLGKNHKSWRDDKFSELEVDDKAMRDEWLESRPARANKEHEEEARRYAAKLKRQWDELKSDDDSSDAQDIVWMVRTAERANVAMDARGMWAPRKMGERQSSTWLFSTPKAPSLGQQLWPAKGGNKPLHSPAHREAAVFNACPNLVYLGAAHGADSWRTLVRQVGFAHGLRGVTSSTSDTLVEVRTKPRGPNFVITGDDGGQLTYAATERAFGSLRSRSGVPLAASTEVFLIAGVRDPLHRVVEAYMQYGIARRGWSPSVENFKEFAFGNFGRRAHVSNLQFKLLAPTKLLTKMDRVDKDGKVTPSSVTNEDILSVLNMYDLVVTPTHELTARLLMKQMLYRIISVRQLLSPPEVGFGNLDKYGFKRMLFQDDLTTALPAELVSYIDSQGFKKRFNRLNSIDARLYRAAEARLLRMWHENQRISEFLQWRETIHDWVIPKLQSSASYNDALKDTHAHPRKAPKCAEGDEQECSTKFEAQADGFVAELQEARDRVCLSENHGCLSRQVINLGISHYKTSRAAELGTLVNKRQTRASYGVDLAAKCAEQAFVKDVQFCPSNSTMGSGLIGKRMIQMAKALYLICARGSCKSLCVPIDWRDKVHVVDGTKVDACLGLDSHVTHFRRATLSHGAVVAHAKQANHHHIGVVEADASFIDPVAEEHPKYKAHEAIRSVAELLTNSEQASDAAFTIIRLGYRAWEFEVGFTACPYGCGCRYNAELTKSDAFCTVTRAQCDLRGSHAYILGRDSYSLFLEPVLSRKAVNKVIDFNVFQRFPQQVIMSPMLAVQTTAITSADFVQPERQRADSDAFIETCRVH